jgi:peptidoglycan-associated lipoprotein
MRKLVLTKTVATLLLALGLTAMIPRRALAQSGSLVDAGVDYNYVRSNAPAGGCGCFALNGGSG